MNDLWNDYARKLLKLPDDATSMELQLLANSTQLWTLVTNHLSHSDSSQWVGAKILVKDCPSNCSVVNKTGILVGSSSQTWMMMVELSITSRRKRKRKGRQNIVEHTRGLKDVQTMQGDPIEAKNNKDDDGKAEREGDKPRKYWKSVVIPKRNSLITLLVPIRKALAAQVHEAEGLVEGMNVDQEPHVLSIDVQEDCSS